MSRASVQRVVTLAMAVLNSAAYGSQTRRSDTLPVRLALAVLWCVLRERSGLSAYWARAVEPTQCPWESCREPWYQIARHLRDEGWHAPVGIQPTEDELCRRDPPLPR